MQETLEIVPRYRIQNIKGKDAIDMDFFILADLDTTLLDTVMVISKKLIDDDAYYTKEYLVVVVTLAPLVDINLGGSMLPILDIYSVPLTYKDKQDILAAFDLAYWYHENVILDPNYTFNEAYEHLFSPKYTDDYNVDPFSYKLSFIKFKVVSEIPPLTEFKIDKTHIYGNAVKPANQKKYRSYPINQCIDYGSLHLPPKTTLYPCSSLKTLDILEVIE